MGKILKLVRVVSLSGSTPSEYLSDVGNFGLPAKEFRLRMARHQAEFNKAVVTLSKLANANEWAKYVLSLIHSNCQAYRAIIQDFGVSVREVRKDGTVVFEVKADQASSFCSCGRIPSNLACHLCSFQTAHRAELSEHYRTAHSGGDLTE